VKEYLTNSHLFLERREDYWGTKPQTKNFHFLMYKEEVQVVNALQTGAVQLARIPFQDVEFVQGLPGIDVELVSCEDQQALMFNISPFSLFYENKDARLAVSHAIDRDSIIRAVYFDFATKAKMPGPAACYDIDERFYNIGIYGHDYDPELAKELAVSSGLIDQEIRLINNGDPRIVLMCEIIQANLRDIGVTCNVTNLDMGSWVYSLFDEEKWDMCIDYSWAQNLLYSSNLRYMVGYMAAESWKNYQWDGHDRAVYLIVDGPELLTTILDADRRKELNLESTKLVIDEMLWLGIVDEVYTWALSSDLRGDAKDYAGDMKIFSRLYLS
jgi:ABC-type transport system substrate-binding protein